MAKTKEKKRSWDGVKFGKQEGCLDCSGCQCKNCNSLKELQFFLCCHFYAEFRLKTASAPATNTTQRNGVMQLWCIVQHELMPELRNEVGVLTLKLEQVVHTLDWVRIEEFDRARLRTSGT